MIGTAAHPTGTEYNADDDVARRTRLDDRNERDIRWGTRVVARFTDEHVRSIVKGLSADDKPALVGL